MTTSDEIREIIRTTLPSAMYTKPGAVLYCGADALRPGPVYLMGLNPGESPEVNRRPIIDSIPKRTAFSEYTHECWLCPQDTECTSHIVDGRVLDSALEKHQRNVIELCRVLGVEPECTFSANAVFGRSTSLATLEEQSGFTLDEWWEHCWAVHRRFLSVVRPRLIVSLGKGYTGSAFALLRRLAPTSPIRNLGETGASGGRAFDALLDVGGGEPLRATVVGVPHPSRWAIGRQLARALEQMSRS